MSTNYFDNASTTRVDSRVLEAMTLYFSKIYGNASSNHGFGKVLKQAIDQARVQVSELINANEYFLISGDKGLIILALLVVLQTQTKAF